MMWHNKGAIRLFEVGKVVAHRGGDVGEFGQDMEDAKPSIIHILAGRQADGKPAGNQMDAGLGHDCAS